LTLKKKDSRKKRQRSTRYILGAIVVALILIEAIIFVGPEGPAEDIGPGDTEAYILGKLTQKPVSDIYTPVLLYNVINKDTAYFLGSGTYVKGQHRFHIVTADHVFGTNTTHVNTAIGVRILRPLEHEITMALSAVIEKGFGGRDIAVASVEDMSAHPAVIHSYSLFSDRLQRLDPCSDVTLASGRRITKLQSLLTGRWYDIVGTSIQEVEPGTPSPLFLNCNMAHGESGSGFQDEERSLYVASSISSQHDRKWESRKADIKKLYSKRIDGVVAVYGPLKITP
jgi:hypothetical protein